MDLLNGSRITAITSGGIDAKVPRIAAFLVRAGYLTPRKSGGSSLPAGLTENAPASVEVTRHPQLPEIDLPYHRRCTMRTFQPKQRQAQDLKTARSRMRSPVFSRQNPEANTILHLQRTIGNQALQQWLYSGAAGPEMSSATHTQGNRQSSTDAELPQPNPLVGLKRGDGLVFGTWHLRPRVQLLQQKLNEKMASSLVIDGMFGPKTAAVLKAFKAAMSVEIAGDLESGEQDLQPGFEAISAEEEVVDRATADALMGANTLSGEIMFVLTPPPPLCQGPSYVCWAAAAASWLNATAMLPGATKEALIYRFAHCICDDGSLPEALVPEVYGELGIELSGVGRFDYDFLKDNLNRHGHVILLVGGSVGHAVVAYAVGVSTTGVPDRDFYSIFDPIDCKYHNLRFGAQDIIRIGRRTQPGNRAVCANVASHCDEE